MKTTSFINNFFPNSFQSKNDLLKRIHEAKQRIANADYVLIGAGAGLSSAAGIHYVGKDFEREFKVFIDKYHITDLYTSSFYPYPNEESRWAYWAKHINFARFAPGALPLYRQLYTLVADKEYFVITTNVDGQFEKSGFDIERIFAIQGDYGKIQCAKGCHLRLYDNHSLVKRMISLQENGEISTEYVPHCPVCGREMDVNIRKDKYFVEDEWWHLQAERYTNFIRKAKSKKLVLLEFGVGFNTPTIIRFPFEEMAEMFLKASLIRFNKDYPHAQSQRMESFIPFGEPLSVDLLAKLTNTTE